MFVIYNLLIYLIMFLILPYLVFKLLTDREWRFGFKERLGLYDWKGTKENRFSKRVWVHASSAGEVRCAILFAKTLLESFKNGTAPEFFISTFTPVGNRMATSAARSLNAPSVRVFFAPIDLPFIIKKVYSNILPDILILVEAELWPNMIREAAKRGIPVVIINGRISTRGYKKFILMKTIWKRLSNAMSKIMAQSERDRARFVSLGFNEERVVVRGNIKAAAVISNSKRNGRGLSEGLKNNLLSLPLVVAGSTHRGEEKEILEGLLPLITSDKLRLILAPRHLERVQEVVKMVRDMGIEPLLRSSMEEEGILERKGGVIVLDTMGELTDFYEISLLCFVGGTLNGLGGHNILEPVIKGRVVVYGQDISNFEEIAEIFEDCGAGYRIKDGKELRDTVVKVIKDPDRYTSFALKGREEVFKLSRSMEKVVSEIRDIIERVER